MKIGPNGNFPLRGIHLRGIHLKSGSPEVSDNLRGKGEGGVDVRLVSYEELRECSLKSLFGTCSY